MTKPSLDLLRSLTDEHVLRALMAEHQLTRAELAARTGISKPTVSESARRLSAAGPVRDTGARTSGRGRGGAHTRRPPPPPNGPGAAGPSGPLERPARPRPVEQGLRAAAAEVRDASPGPVRLCVVSAADPV